MRMKCMRSERVRERKKGKFMHANEVDKEEEKFNLNIQQKCRVFGTAIYRSSFSIRSKSFLLFSYR